MLWILSYAGLVLGVFTTTQKSSIQNACGCFLIRIHLKTMRTIDRQSEFMVDFLKALSCQKHICVHPHCKRGFK